MSIFYLNHNVLEYQSEENGVMNKLNEVVDLIKYLKKEHHQMFVFSNLWNIPILGGTLRSFLHNMTNREEAKLLVISLMNTGPFYYEDTFNENLDINPIVQKDHYVHKLLTICFHDKHPLILSLSEEEHLFERKYYISENFTFHEVDNYISWDGLPQYFEGIDNPADINNVFEILETKRSNIKILEKAKKSAKQHNFQGRFLDVLRVIYALEDIELKSVLEGVPDEVRTKVFFEETGFEISRESDMTLKVRRYRAEREFIVPGLGKQLFEWHVKIGRTIRIHFFIDRDNQKVYIGHCGRHLGTVSYNS